MIYYLVEYDKVSGLGGNLFMNDEKQLIMDEIKNHSEIVKPVSSIRFRIRCPICGDSQKDFRDAHCYIKCNLNDPTEPVLYNCFLCNAHGKVNSDFLMKLGVKSDIATKITKKRYNRLSASNISNIEIMTGTVNMNSDQVKYINYRLGPGLTAEDFEKFKIVWDMDTLKKCITNTSTINTLPNNRNSISFISENKQMILIRTFENQYFGTHEHDTGMLRWIKRYLFNSNNNDRTFYTIKSQVDLFTKDDIVVNIAEGIIDIISVYKNFTDVPNSAYLAVLGSDYLKGVDFIISKGLIGSNVQLRIYVDSDVDINKIKGPVKKYKWLFKSISFYQNIKSKDVGVPIDQIKLREYKI